MKSNTVDTSTLQLSEMNDEAVIKLWVKENYAADRPENLSVIAPVDVSPPANKLPLILGEAFVRSEWSDTSKIQCNVCGNRAKFKSGGYFAYYGDDYIYVVGPVCGSDTHRSNLQKAKNLYEKRLKAERASENIEKFRKEFASFRNRLIAVETFCTNISKARFMHTSEDLFWREFGRKCRNALKESNGRLYDNADEYIGKINCAIIFGTGDFKIKQLLDCLNYLNKYFGFDLRSENFEINCQTKHQLKLSDKLSELRKLVVSVESEKELLQKTLENDVQTLRAFFNNSHENMKFSDGILKFYRSQHYDRYEWHQVDFNF